MGSPYQWGFWVTSTYHTGARAALHFSRQCVDIVSCVEIVKNVVLAIHILGVAGIIGGVLAQISSMRTGTAKVTSLISHGAWTMLVTGLILVGLQYPLGHDVNNAKIAVKSVVLIAVLVLALVYKRKDTAPGWVLPTIAGLTVTNVLIATIW